MREKKTDTELLLDFRFSNKYGQFLFDRIKNRSHESRLGLNGKNITKNLIKKSFHKLALIWHPDNINKKYRYCFANKKAFFALVNDIFLLFKESYNILN